MAISRVADDPALLGERFAQASAEYHRLAASLSALGVELEALGSALGGREFVGMRSLEMELPRPVLRAYLLGPFQLMVGERKISAELPGQAQTVLKYLVSHRKHSVSRESLLDLLWPDADPSAGQGRLRVLVHTLRKSLSVWDEVLGGKQVIIAQGGNIALNPELDLWVDVEAFERHWHEGWKLKRDGKISEAMKQYEEAEGLYTGDYLADEAYADWTLLKREALRDAHSTILTMLAGMCSEAGDDMGAIIWAQKLLAQDDCREDAYRHLIVSHARLGQTGRAFQWFQLCVKTLKRELGIEPGTETQAVVAACGLREWVAPTF